MSDESPAGFVPYREPSPFLDRAGPFYERDDGAGLVFALRVQAHHCNRRNLAHGGLLVTLADVALGKTAEWRGGARLITTGIAYDFMGAAPLGAWVEARVDFHKLGRDLAFANCYLSADGKIVGRASGQYKVVPER